MKINKGLCTKRKSKDIIKLKMSDYQVTVDTLDHSKLEVLFKGPDNSPYENGRWLVNVELPKEYPYKSPSIGFKDRIFHPNIDLQ